MGASKSNGSEGAKRAWIDWHEKGTKEGIE
jgi:hypothetical protein